MALRADVQSINAKYLNELEARVTLENQTSLHEAHMQKKFDMDMKTVETRATTMDNERAHDKVRGAQIQLQPLLLFIALTCHAMVYE